MAKASFNGVAAILGRHTLTTLIGAGVGIAGAVWTMSDDVTRNEERIRNLERTVERVLDNCGQCFRERFWQNYERRPP